MKMSFLPGTHLDWNFSCLLDTIASSIHNENFNDLKTRLKGTCSVIDEVVDNAGSITDLFEELRDRQLLGRNNLDFLYRILNEIGDKDLLIQTMNYQKLHGQEISFHRILNQNPADGFGYITSYISGADAGRFDMACLNDFKSRISSFLIIPSTHCFIAGVEPTSELSIEGAMKIALMVPEINIDALEKWMTENSDMNHLQKLHIVRLETRNKTFEIEGYRDKLPAEEGHFKSVASLYESLQERENELNRAEEILQTKIEELGKSSCLPERLLRLHQKSGMSVTLWKTLVKSRTGKLATHYIPKQTYFDIEKCSLYSKIQRIYPQIQVQCQKQKQSEPLKQ